MPAFDGGFNRSTQHLLILPDGEVSDGVACTDMVHAEAASRALGALEGRSMRSGYRPVLLSGGTKAASTGCWRLMEGSLHCRGGELRKL